RLRDGHAFGDRRIVLDGHAEMHRHRLESLYAPDVRARDQPGDGPAGQRRHHRARLTAPSVVDRAKPVVSGPTVAVASPRVTHEKHERSEGRLDGIQDRAVARVGELATGGRQRHPADLIDLVVRHEPTVTDGHHPVANALVPTPAITVPARAELGPEETVKARLLGDLAERAVLLRLAGLDLALRQRPVPVAGAMDQENL